MLRARRKKCKGKREKRVKKKCVDERETLFYEQQILDNNRELARVNIHVYMRCLRAQPPEI